MKKLLTTLLFLSLTSIGFCTKPCNGLCGFKLGEKISKDKILETTQTLESGQKTYVTQNFTKFMDFNNVVVDVFKDDSIFLINLVTYKNNYDADIYFFKVLQAIETFYEIDDKDKQIINLPHKKNANYVFPNGVSMNVSCVKRRNSLPEISIYLTSKELFEKSRKEQVEASIDTSALE